jgi:hypothetical protein
VRKDQEARGMRQSAWLKRLGSMLRAKRPLVKQPYSCALVSPNHADYRNQLSQLPATHCERVLGAVPLRLCLAFEQVREMDEGREG